MRGVLSVAVSQLAKAGMLGIENNVGKTDISIEKR
jgi:hypothetical protein